MGQPTRRIQSQRAQKIQNVHVWRHGCAPPRARKTEKSKGRGSTNGIDPEQSHSCRSAWSDHPSDLPRLDPRITPPSLPSHISHGNSDPFGTLALSRPLGAAVSQIIAWHRDVQIQNAYPSSPGSLPNSKSIKPSWQDAVTCLHTPALADAFLACRAATMAWMLSSTNPSNDPHSLRFRRMALEAKISAYRSLARLTGLSQQQEQAAAPTVFRAAIFLYWAEIAFGDMAAAEAHANMLEHVAKQADDPDVETSTTNQAGIKDDHGAKHTVRSLRDQGTQARREYKSASEGIKKSSSVGKWVKLVDPYKHEALLSDTPSFNKTGGIQDKRIGPIFSCMKDLFALEAFVARSTARLRSDSEALEDVLDREEALQSRLRTLILPNWERGEQFMPQLLPDRHTSLAICLAVGAIFLIDMALDDFAPSPPRSWLSLALRNYLPSTESFISEKFRMWLTYLAEDRPKISKDSQPWFRFIFVTETRAMGLSQS